MQPHANEKTGFNAEACAGAANLLRWAVLLVGLHSLALGTFIYWFTGAFYQLFFAAPVENLFFVRQSGIFLFLAGLFYLFPLFDLTKFNRLVLLIVFSKFSAVVFLITNARYTLDPFMIYLAAAGDAAMGAVLLVVYGVCGRARYFSL